MRAFALRPILFGLPAARSGTLLPAFFLILTLAAILALPSWVAGNTPATGRWPVCDGAAASQQVSFVHVSDIHAHYNPEADGETPVGRIRGVYQAVKRENPYTVFTDGGDDYEKGSLAEELSQGQTTREIVHALGFDIRTLGNHDFAWGYGELLKFSGDLRAAVLSANFRQADGRQPWTEYQELQVGCVRIGFFGLTTRPFDITGHQYDGPVYPEHPAVVATYDYRGIAGRIIAEHRQEVDLLVLVSHLGIAEDLRLAEATDGIDLILGGHSHTELQQPIRVKNTLIAHPGACAEYISRIDLRYDLNAGSLTGSEYRLVANRPGMTPKDAGVDRAVAGILRPYRQQLDETVAAVRKKQERRKIAAIAAIAAVNRSGVDAAFIDPLSVWAGTWRGPLTRQDLLDTFKIEHEPVGTPSISSLYLLRVRGADLLLAREKLPDFAYAGPRGEIAADGIYTIAMQKAQAIRQQEVFGRAISLQPPQPLADLWMTVAAFARDRGLKGLTLDGEPEQSSLGEAQGLVAGAGDGSDLRDGRRPRS